jgi:hypothetical protein
LRDASRGISLEKWWNLTSPFLSKMGIWRE